MTHPLAPGSPRRAAASRFGGLLSEAMARAGVGDRGLARQLGTSAGLIYQWRAGNNLPRLETAIRLSEALGDPRLASVAREARTQRCEACGTAVVNEGGTPLRYCSQACKVVRNQMRSGTPARERAVVAERALDLYRASVDAHCRGCEPEGLCRDAGCALRPASPLRLARREAPTVTSVTPDAPRVIPAAHRAAVGAASRARWADPGYRERTGAAVSAALRARSPEDAASWRRAIGEAQRQRRGLVP